MADAKTPVPTRQEEVLDYIEITGALMERTQEMVTTKKAQDQRIEKLIPGVVQALADNGRIEADEKEAAAKLLRNPEMVLEILKKTAMHRNTAERAQLGEPLQNGQTKKANYNSTGDGYVGRRSRPGEAESDKAFKRGLGF